MPKMKTHSGAKKRFKLTATGKVRGRHSYSTHILEKKSPKRKRHHRRPAEISKDDAPRIKVLLGAKARRSRAGQARQPDDAAAARSGEPGGRAGGNAAAEQANRKAGPEAPRRNS
jgi:large subunit ribosomal protein L35